MAFMYTSFPNDLVARVKDLPRISTGERGSPSIFRPMVWYCQHNTTEALIRQLSVSAYTSVERPTFKVYGKNLCCSKARSARICVTATYTITYFCAGDCLPQNRSRNAIVYPTVSIVQTRREAGLECVRPSTRSHPKYLPRSATPPKSQISTVAETFGNSMQTSGFCDICVLDLQTLVVECLKSYHSVRTRQKEKNSPVHNSIDGTNTLTERLVEKIRKAEWPDVLHQHHSRIHLLQQE